MVTSQNAPSMKPHEEPSRSLDTPELIERLAENLRLTSGIDLPHAYFVEQVKLQLAGSTAFDASLVANADGNKAGSGSQYQSAALFKAWAIPE